MAEDFNVGYVATAVDDNTVAVTGVSREELEKRGNEILSAALDDYNALNRPQIYSVFPNDTSSSADLTLEKISELSVGINSNLSNLEQVNQIILQNVNSDPLMSYSYRTIMANIPTDYAVSYVSADGESPEDLKDSEEYVKTKLAIERFNRDIKLKRLIPKVVGTTWLEGNTPMMLRTKNGTGAIDILPLAILHPSSYTILGDNVMQCEVSTLQTRLQKSYPKTKGTKKSVYFENLAKEIEATFPREVVQAYRSRESICRLPITHADCVKINSCNRPYGVSPFFCSLRPLTLLKKLESADASEARARSKYIIFQKLRKELLGASGQYTGLAEQSLAHNNLVQALKTSLVAYTAAPFVESLEFVSAKSTGEDSVKLNTTYTTKYLESLGISWTDVELPNGTMANLSVSNLIKSINCVLQDLERVMNKFYLTILKDNGISDPAFIPELHIAKAESLELGLKKDLAQFIYGTLNGSLTTAFKMLDIDIENEAYLRSEEQRKGYDQIFAPHATAYTTSGGDTGAGRPQSNGTDADVDKQDYDKNNYESKR